MTKKIKNQMPKFSDATSRNPMLKARCGYLTTLLLSMLLLSGCYSASLVSSYDSDRLVPQKTTQWCFAWGIIKPKDKQAGCGHENVANVTIKTNFIYKAIAFLSAGTVVPIQIEWQCSPPEEEIELLGGVND